MRSVFFFLFSFCTVMQAYGWVLRGTVRDGETREALAFVNIAAKEATSGTISDINGQFVFNIEPGYRNIVFTYVGYHKARISVDTLDHQKPLVVFLSPKTTELSVVVVRPGTNPAVRIIRNAVANKAQNNPELLPAYRCRMYNKIRYMAAPDFATKRAKDENEKEKFDKYMQNHHLLLMESFVKRTHVHNSPAQETVVATRVSGFRSPDFGVLATQFQPFSFYEDVITLLDKDYYNPISKNSWKQYLFALKDTNISGSDTTFIMQFQPASGSAIDGLRGTLGIHSGSFALAFVRATPAKKDMNNIRIQQHYNRVDSFFFPDQLDFELHFNALGLRLVGHSYIDSVEMGIDRSSVILRHLSTRMADSATLRPSRYWSCRPVPLDATDSNTYHYLDSLGVAENLDKKMYYIEQLSQGYLPMGPVSIKFNDLWSYNAHEGNRFELALTTNNNLSRQFELGVYGAYGLRDDQWKYGSSLYWHMKNNKQTGIGFEWKHDVLPAGTVMRVEKVKTSSTEHQYDFYRRLMLYRDDYSVQGTVLIWQSLQAGIHVTQRYRSGLTMDLMSDGKRHPITELGMDLRLAIGEQYASYAGNELRFGGKWPVLWLRLDQINYAAMHIAANSAHYRLWGRVYYHLVTRPLGAFEWVAEAGMTSKGTAVEEGFIARGVNTRSAELRVDNAFITVPPYRYFNNRYVYLFMNWAVHRFTPATKYSRPLVVLHQNTGYGGQIDITNNTPAPIFRDFSGLYIESGVTLQDLYRYPLMDAFFIGFGIGGFYHYGSGSQPLWRDNAALTMDITGSF